MRENIVNGWSLYFLSAVLGAAAIFYAGQDLWQVSVLLVVAAIFCYRNGTRAQIKRSGFSVLYYRTGDAMEKTHRFPRLLAEVLSLHAKRVADPISIGQLDALGETERARLLENVYGELGKEIGSEFPKDILRDRGTADAKNVQFCRSLAEDYFVVHATQLKSVSGRSYLTRSLWDAHMIVRASNGWLSDLSRRIEKHADRGEKK